MGEWRDQPALREGQDLSLPAPARGAKVLFAASQGRTVFEVVVRDDGETFKRRHDSGYGVGRQSMEAIDQQLFDAFDGADADWRSGDSDGNSSLHLVARHKSKKTGYHDRIAFTARFLLVKGLDPSVVNEDGETAVDLAWEAASSTGLHSIDRGRVQEDEVMSEWLGSMVGMDDAVRAICLSFKTVSARRYSGSQYWLQQVSLHKPVNRLLKHEMERNTHKEDMDHELQSARTLSHVHL